MENKYTNIVVSGGGIKGIVYIGAFFALNELNILDKIQNFAGSSIGALVATLYIIGYKPSEIFEFIKQTNLSKLKNFDINHLNTFGIDNGEKIEDTIRTLIKQKNLNPDITLLELYNITKKKLIITTTNINSMQLCYLTHESFPDLSLYKALRMTTAIPLIYSPIIYNNQSYVDGGCIDNYPISVFGNELDKTIGLCLINSSNNMDKIPDLESYLFRIFNCLMYGISYNSFKGYENYTIKLNAGDISTIDFDISDKIKNDLFLVGYKAIYDKFVT